MNVNLSEEDLERTQDIVAELKKTRREIEALQEKANALEKHLEIYQEKCTHEKTKDHYTGHGNKHWWTCCICNETDWN